MFAMFSMILTGITILKHPVLKVRLKDSVSKRFKNKLQYDLGFLKSEWEF